MPHVAIATSALALAVVVVPAFAQSELLVGSWATDSVRRYDVATGQYLGDLVAPGLGGLDVPDGLAWGADRRLYVASSNSGQVLRYEEDGTLVGPFIGGLSLPGNLQFGPDGRLYVCEKGTNRVLRFDQSSGALLGVSAQGGGLMNPVGLAWNGGVLYVAGFGSNAVHRFDAATGAALSNLAAIATPLILRVAPSNELHVSTHQLDSVRRLDIATGQQLGVIGPGGPIDCPVGHVVAPDGTILVASWQNHRILRYDQSSGQYLSTFAQGGGLFQPNDLLLSLPDLCYADCDGSGALNVFDYICFSDAYAISKPYADCDGSLTFTVFDYLCFGNAYSAGCP